MKYNITETKVLLSAYKNSGVHSVVTERVKAYGGNSFVHETRISGSREINACAKLRDLGLLTLESKEDIRDTERHTSKYYTESVWKLTERGEAVAFRLDHGLST